jgi:uncharacterized protein with ParB-like and HNH nuclease domain
VTENQELNPNESLEQLPEERFEDEDYVPGDTEPALNDGDGAPQERKLVTHPYDFIIRSLKDQIEDQTLILQDEFQRRQVWDDVRASRLIESLMINVPIPVCYFAELETGAYSVVDGQQRLTSIYRYVTNQFALRALRVRKEHIGKRFHQLDLPTQRSITSRTIRCIVILRESHPTIRFDVFDRLNSGSVRLNAQELRNCLFRGELNKLVRQLAAYPAFQKARNVSDIDKRMQDDELVLRFFAFNYKLDQYKGDFAAFLNDYFADGKRMRAEDLEAHERLFRHVIDDVVFVFADEAFKRYDENGRAEKLINRSIYDIIMLSFARGESEKLRANRDSIVTALKRLCLDPSFLDAVQSGTLGTKRLQTRLDKWQQALTQVGIEIPPFLVGRQK